VKYLLLFLCLVLSLAWFVNKNVLYDGLEYTVDVITNLQAARSVFVGEELFHEYLAGGLRGIHNHFILLLIGPLTLISGARAFFAVTALLQAGASTRLVASAEPGTLAKVSSILAAMLFGPLMFWIVDNPFYGWEPELLYPFLAILFAEALVHQRKTMWLWGALIVLCREDAALLAGGITVLWLASKRAPIRQMIRAYTMWLFVFALSMLLLRLLHKPGSEDRITTAFGGLLEMWHNHALLADFSVSALGALAMFVAGLIPLFALGGKRLAAWAMLVSLPLWGVATIATLSYAKEPAGVQLHGLLWVPRFALFWSILLAACAFALRENVQTLRTPAVIACILLSIPLQLQLLKVFRNYSVPARIAGISPRVADQLSPRSLQWIGCLGHSLPRKTVVEPHWNLQALFEKQIIVADSHHTSDKPDLFICDSQGRLPLPGQACLGQMYASLAQGYVAGGGDGILFTANPSLRPVIEMCAPR
jgi:hypothetical protein